MKKSATFLTLGTIIGVVLQSRFNITGKLTGLVLNAKKKVDKYRSEATKEQPEFDEPK